MKLARSPSKQGFTLVELMVSISIGLLLLAATVTASVGLQKSFSAADHFFFGFLDAAFERARVRIRELQERSKERLRQAEAELRWSLEQLGERQHGDDDIGHA